MSKPKVVRSFTPEFYRRHEKQLSKALAKKLSSWGAHGFRIVGTPPRLYAEVVVAQTVQNPERAVEPIQVGPRWIKPRVRSSRVTLRRMGLLDGSSPTAIGAARAVAPGARIRIGRNQVQEFVGIAAVVTVAGKPAILTCGHAQAFAFSDELLAGDEPDGDAIARLDVNLLAGSSPLDAALCPLTDAGVALLQASNQAPTWRFKNVRTPSPADNQKSSVFWQTHDGDNSAPTADVETFSGRRTRPTTGRTATRRFKAD